MPASSTYPTGIAHDLNALLRLRATAQGLNLGSKGKALSLQAGGYHSRFRGRGLEFDEVRPYQPGDDSRDIDWRVTARRGKPHTKLYNEERERPVWLLTDLGASMFFGSQRSLKSALAAEASALLAWAAAQGGDRIGGIVHGVHEWRPVPPKARRRGVLGLLQALAHLQPSRLAEISGLTGKQTASESAQEARQDARSVHHDDFNHCLQRATALIRPGSRVFVLSDFQTLDTRGERSLRKLSHHNEPILIRISDPIENTAPPPGRYRMGKPGHILELDTSDPILRDNWQAAQYTRQQTLKQLAQQLRTPLIELSTANPPLEALRRGLGARHHAADSHNPAAATDEAWWGIGP